MEKEEEKSLAESLTTLTKLVRQLRSEKYLQMIENKKKFLFYNFLSGIARGTGLAIGTTFAVGLVIWITSLFINIPLLGDWILNIIEYVQENS